MTTAGFPSDPGTAFAEIAGNVQRVVQGKPRIVRLAVTALFAEGHLLIEDNPGLGKTTLARSLAASVGGRFTRIQFTPDLLPGEITGGQVFHRDTGEFTFHPGPVFGNVVLADEINRGTPKTQSALLEVMSEAAVTVDSVRHRVPRPFMVVATQNPIEMEGTYRLPEAQLDRFLMRVKMGYPEADDEVRVVLDDNAGVSPDSLAPVLSLEQLRAMLAMVASVRVDPVLARYAVDLAAATRSAAGVVVGASPRGSVALIRAARAWAATFGRSTVTTDDVRAVAHPVLDHRIILGPEAEFSGRTADAVVNEALLAMNDQQTLAAAAWRR